MFCRTKDGLFSVVTMGKSQNWAGWKMKQLVSHKTPSIPRFSLVKGMRCT